MVTLPLERMASRVAASLCFATGLGHEMVVNSQRVSVICIKLHSCVCHFAFVHTLCSCCSPCCCLSACCGDTDSM